MTHTILQGDVRTQLATIPDNTVRCCVTSPLAQARIDAVPIPLA